MGRSKCTYFWRRASAKIDTIEFVIGFSGGSRPLIYLGALTAIGRSGVCYFQPLVEKIHHCIKGGGSRFLNMSNRLVLVKHVLSSIPIHILAVSRIPTQIGDVIDRLLRDFLWGYKHG